MKETHEYILSDLEAWVDDDQAPRVCWVSGMAGTGKSSIAHTLCERLDAKGTLGGSFFCTRSATALSDPSHIIPTVAWMLARSSLRIRSELCQVLEDHPDAASLNVLREQVELLVKRHLQKALEGENKSYKVIIIDAIDECSSQRKLESLISTICDEIPLKFLFSSRPEAWIEDAFSSKEKLSLKRFSLHDVTEESVRSDIKLFLESSLSGIARNRKRFLDSPDWPPNQELIMLLDRSGGLFIYAATAMRYVGAPNVDFRERLTEMTHTGPSSSLQTVSIDRLYFKIMELAFRNLEAPERARRRDILATVIFLHRPLSVDGIASLLTCINIKLKSI